jgi:DNA-binding transcriptional LysR family regulator
MAFKGQLTGRLKISVVSTGKYVMPFFLADFMQANPGVDLLMDVTNKETVVKSLANNEVDFALVSILPKNMPVEQLQLLQNKLYLVGKQNPLQGKNSKAPDFFSRFPLIYRENGSGTRQVMEGFIAGNHIPVLKKMELTTNEAVKQAVLAGLGYSVMPLIGLKNELINRELHIIPFKGLPITTTWSLVWLKGKKHTQVSQAFLAYLKKHKTEIIAEQFKWYEVYK